MAWKYPKISHLLTYKEQDEHTVAVTDYMTDEKYLIDTEIADYIQKLDGHTDPYDIPTILTTDEIDVLIQELDENELLMQKRCTYGWGGFMLPLWLPKESELQRKVSSLWNMLLLVIWFPVFVLGFYMVWSSPETIPDTHWLLGSFLGLVVGMILHELGHLVACLAYGGKVFELGFFSRFIVLFGAYVRLDEKTIKRRWWRIQTYAAGVEMNMLVCGICMILSVVCQEKSGVLCYMGITNVTLGIINSLALFGLDGLKVMGELLGFRNGVESAFLNFILDPMIGRNVKNAGMAGKGILITTGIVFIIQIMFPIILMLNIWSVVICFI